MGGGQPPLDLNQINQDIRTVRQGMIRAGVPVKLFSAIETRALRSGRRTTGAFRSNRESRWRLDPQDPQYGSELDCKIMLLRLLGMVLEFRNAPAVDAATSQLLTRYVGKKIVTGDYRDVLTKERLDYRVLAAEAAAARHGISSFHLGHVDPTAIPRHTPENVSWRSERSNLLQGNLTLDQARSRLVEIIARYFGLGEVRIEPD
jgi:hypothetical protein